MKPRYERAASLILSCLSVGSLLQIIRLFFPTVTLLVSLFLILYISASAIYFSKAFYHDWGKETFDLTGPTTFDRGLLIFKSNGETCAVFFSLSILMRNIALENIRRPLTILMKVLPSSSVLSLEWTTDCKCYINFYTKMDKRRILIRSKELLDNIQTSFQTMFGENNVKILSEEKLLRHLALGMSGKIRQASIYNKYSVMLKTDRTQQAISLIKLHPNQDEQIQPVLRELIDHGTARIIFAVNKAETQHTQASPMVLLFTTCNRNDLSSSQSLLKPVAIQRTRASELIQNLGDVLTRNIFRLGSHYIPFETAVNEIISFLSTCNQMSNEFSEMAATSPPPLQASVCNLEWKEELTLLSRRLGFRIERDIIIFFNQFPIRIDAKINDILFKIIPKYYNDIKKLEWLISQFKSGIKQHKAKELVLLLCDPSIGTALQNVVRRSGERFRIIQAITELEMFLFRFKGTLQNVVDVSAETV